jgi:hypothetical protein
MKTNLLAYSFLALGLLTLTSMPLSTAIAQGTAFTYQGQLTDGGSPANGNYDIRFYLYDSATGGSVLAGPVTNAPVPVTNGYFTVMIDFGPGAFTGSSNWLDVGVRTNGSPTAYTSLIPRQQLTPTPYAVFAEGSAAAGLTGTIPASGLSGTYGGAVTLNNAGNNFSGNGSGLTGLNASQLTSGTMPNARLAPDVALTDVSQTFIKTNIFASGTGAGRLIISNTFVGVDTNLFTGLSLQYDGSYGESALMSSYNDGFAYLSFYTKAGGGYPIAKQMIIDRIGGVAIDQQNANNGVINDGSTNGTGLTFGITSGEGVASKRTPGGNQYGLDFYTEFANRMSISQAGFVGIGRQTPVDGNELFGLYGPVTNTWRGMFIETGVGGRPFYGYSQAGSTGCWTEENGQDGNKWELYNSGNWLTVTPGGLVGIDTTTPSETLEINGTSRLDDNTMYLRAGTDRNHGLVYQNTVDGIFFDGPFLFGFNGGALGTSNPNTVTLKWFYDGTVWISNNCSVASLTIRGGADLAEPFKISSRNGDVPQGAVVVIDEANPGRLKMSDRSYDTHVAGVLSGANGVNPGIQMQQQGVLEGGKNVALTGRVYVQADTSNGAIKPGDLLTTSDIPGDAMKVTDHARAAGAILGKAMTGLGDGKGMVLVLVTLQ